MATSNRDRVNRGMDLLKEGLCPFVIREMRSRYMHGWWPEYQARNPGLRMSSPTELDTQALLKLMRDEWRNVFGGTLGKFEQNLVHELLDTRNNWAHQAAFSTDDTERALDSIKRLLQAISAGEQADAVERERQTVRRQQYEDQAKREERRATALPIAGQAAEGLRPWREIITPHPDVQRGVFQQAEFAADLAQVHRGEGTPEYRDPLEFFRRTYLTDGLRTLLRNALQRLAGTGGDPVIELQTNFGGGKTHSMLALYHVCDDVELGRLPGIEPVLREAGIDDVPLTNRAVLVGTAMSPGTPRIQEDGTEVRTLWGELAWQLGGREGYALVAEDDRQGVSPGSATLARLFRAHQPSLILIDEWVAFVRQLYNVDGLPAGSFDANLSFAQSLTEAVRQTPQTLLVASLPSSDIEIGGTAGFEALERLRNTFGRMQASWRPATTEEGFEIVRRRLFEPIGEKERYTARDAVIRAFTELYRKEAGQFPRDVNEGDYRSRMEAAYPIHPELFDQLYGAWSTLDKFQRTRGVLRLMASVIHALWQRQDASLLILPASIPMDAGPVFDELTRYLDNPWKPVIERDVDGPQSLPLRLDGENPNFGRFSAARRVARTVYLGSAPTYDTSNRGIDDRRIKLGCAQPGESVAIFGDALRTLTDHATHLYVDRGRYWFSTQPSVTRTANERAQALSQDEVFHEIANRLKSEQAKRGDFASVHPCPSSTADVRDEPTARLVILDPEHAHARGTDSPALQAATTLLNQRGDSPRLYRNCLVIVAADRTRLADLEQAVRQSIAWGGIVKESTQLNLDAFQEAQAKTKSDGANEAVRQRLPETYTWLLVPRQELRGELEWDEFRTQGEGAIPERASQRLRNEGLLVTRYGPTLLRNQLDQVPLWRGANHVTVIQLADDFAQYLYLPRLRDSQVLVNAVAEGAASLTWSTETFAYAEQWDEGQSRYLGLVAGGQRPVPVLNGQSVLVRPEIAQRQLDTDRSPGPGPEPTDDDEEEVIGPGPGPTPQPPIRQTRRYYGQLRLDPSSMSTQSGRVAEAVVQHLAALLNADVKVTLEIDARVPTGIPEDVIRIVNENSRTLRFTNHGFEEE